MSKNKKNSYVENPKPKATAPTTPKAKSKKRSFHLPLLPTPVIAFVLLWLWMACWQGDVFRIIRENSFFAFDETLMQYEMDKPNGLLWTIGRGLLMTFRHPWMGATLLAFMLTATCWMLGYVLRLKGNLRWLQYLPIGIFTGIFTYQGVASWHEAESGHVIGFPLAVFLIIAVMALLVRLFLRKPLPALIRIPTDETPRQNHLQIYVLLLVLGLPMFYAQQSRPYVRPLAKMQMAVAEKDWQRVIDIAHANSEISNRPMAAYYAMALVQTGQIGDRMFDIRLDYDTIHTKGLNGVNNPANIYLMECDFHSGLAETAYHHAMESMVMEGPTIRNLKMLCKTSLLRGEWEAAEKYLTILDHVPFEGAFVDNYRPMLRDSARVNADPEFAVVRQLEPIHDIFENTLILPTFLGYNTAIIQGRSTQALVNATMVSIYTKSMPALMARAQAFIGTTPPASIMEALTLLSGKTPELRKAFPGIDMNLPRLESFLADTRQYVATPEDRAKHAAELFPKFKGYYPYYYFFGNLKATRKAAKENNSSAGVN